MRPAKISAGQPSRATLGAFAVAALAALVAALGCHATPASAATVATLEPSFSATKPGAATSVTLTGRFTGEGGELPSPLRKATVFLPAGLANSPEWPRTAGCSRSHLQAHGVDGCPAHSEIGTGSALFEWHEGAGTTSERAQLYMFVGPTNGSFTLQLLGEGRHPIHKRAVISIELAAVSSPFSASLEESVPPVAPKQGGPEASLIEFSVTVGPSTKPPHSASRAARKRWGDMGLFVPRHCPNGGYPWLAELGYADGETQEARAAVPCG